MSYRRMGEGIPNETYCSFCGKPAYEAVAMVEGPDETFICEDCIAACAEAVMFELDVDLKPNEYGRVVWTQEIDLARDRQAGVRDAGHRPRKKAPVFARPKGIPTPQEIYQKLSEHVVGQEAAKTILAVAVYNHFARVLAKASGCCGGVEIEKSNVMLIGPTGSGKTLLAKTLAKTLHVPFAMADATTLTEAGYVGEDVESVLRRLIEAADGDVKRAEMGIVYIDEIDKIACKADGVGRSDPSGKGAQQGLLKILEGTEASVPKTGGPKKSDSENYLIDTKDILFIVGGAFPGLGDIVASRTRGATVGFASPQAGVDGDYGRKDLDGLVPDDLDSFGMLPELVGRTPVIAVLDELGEEELMRIQTEPKSAIARQYEAQFRFEGCELAFTDGAIRAIAREAMGLGTGVRGLRSVYERVLRLAMFELPSHSGLTSVLVEESDVLGETSPLIRDGYDTCELEESRPLAAAASY